MLLELLRNKRGSPLLEEGLLVGLALVLFGVLISAIMGIFGWFQAASQPLGNLGGGLGTLFQEILQGYLKIFKFLTGQG
ncbi:hypothetical protein B9P99_01085 [Candidatus Marsarchaeota G1 archaeon OSP_B]|jgi:hypothetical protein|uniref:Uncharacterized protein n=3 Tax=Candidatus Marsarchaeota group 1 TaxID=2203770 RepID=A0A2R6AKC0_9ARCH|nr:MAG: hypothetical protein B9Q02_01125 [Candidatus Marsarchaeota G1 archaeon BE_D]PSN88896.1 MAG: hypothetical protein B9Q00_03845 [Candidatus Marsarchaeota G1 archaeon OSP_C]PSN95377.1 MAG: hypothetical protein B9P99_01085 [Candidatus Marsarchaeota G1 archaeon OSP_B]